MGRSSPPQEPSNHVPTSHVPPPLGLCSVVVQEEAFRPYYTPVLTSTGVICVTRCSKQSDDPYPCVHGTCSVVNTGPQCE